MIRFDSGLLGRSAGFRAFLNHSRWIASVTVVIGHTRNTLMVPYAEIVDPGPLTVVFYFLTNFHFEAVMVFFALSGFLVGGMALDLYLSGRFDAGRYFANRLARLYLPLIPVLALSYLVDAVIASSIVTGDELYRSIELGAVALHAVFLQEIITSTMPINISLWSLTNEFWYYLMFGAFLSALHARNHDRKNYLPYLAVFGAALIFMVVFGKLALGATLLYMPMWLLGVIAWLKLPFRVPLPLSGLAFVAALLLARSHLIDDYYFLRDLLIALSFVAVMVSFKDYGAGNAADGERRPKIGDRLGVTMAAFSYSLYLVHFPIIMLTAKVLRHVFERTTLLHPSDAAAYPIIIGLIVAIIIAGYGFYWLTERHTGVVRARLYGLLAERR